MTANLIYITRRCRFESQLNEKERGETREPTVEMLINYQSAQMPMPTTIQPMRFSNVSYYGTCWHSHSSALVSYDLDLSASAEEAVLLRLNQNMPKIRTCRSSISTSIKLAYGSAPVYRSSKTSTLHWSIIIWRHLLSRSSKVSCGDIQYVALKYRMETLLKRHLGCCCNGSYVSSHLRCCNVPYYVAATYPTTSLLTTLLQIGIY